ncbi:MAG: hypothetical protein K2G44_04480 [Clostridia bacterium]|nr:hypothetical protein [Clostridia bacterium]
MKESKQPRFGFKLEYGLKTTVFALLSLCFSIAFAIMNGVIAVREQSVWYGALAGYYVLLILFRGITVAADRLSKRKCNDERAYASTRNKIYLGCGAFLVIVEIAMCIAVTQMVMYGRPVRGGTIFAIATAAYTFYKIVMAIVHVVKASKYKDPVSQALRNLNFADACMSMASLTVLMLSVFDEGNDLTFAIAMKACAGFAACAAVLAVATVMIVKAAKKLGEGKDND